MVVTALLLPVMLLLILFRLDAWEHLLFHQDSGPPPNRPPPACESVVPRHDVDQTAGWTALRRSRAFPWGRQAHVHRRPLRAH